MKRMLFLIPLIILGLLIQPSPKLLAQSSQGGYKTQTIMIYIVGSDLESQGGLATGDIREMLQARPDQERLNVLVLTGGTTRWSTRVIPNDQLGVYRIEGANPKLVRKWESASMGDPETLRQFLAYGVDTYPADSYGLVLWDHGGGPMVGFGVDTLFRHDGLTLFELGEALESSPFGQGMKLEWLAFDACLMASLEVASMLSPFANYLVASEETLPGHGFDYRFLAALSGTSLTGPEAGREIINQTYAFYEKLSLSQPQQKNLVTLSLMDLSQASGAQEALGALFSSLDKGLALGIYSEVARRRDQAKAYGRTSTTDDYDLIDLYDLADKLASLYPEESEALKAQIAGMVLHNQANVPNSHGLSLYFPMANKDLYGNLWAGLYQSFDVAPAYKAFMDNYGEILLSGSLVDWTGDEAPAVTYDEETGLYFIQLSPEQAANYKSGQYYVLSPVWGEEYMLVYMSSDVTLDEELRLQANFNGKTMFIQNASGGQSVVPLMQEKENIGGIASYQIPMVLDRNTPEGGYESVGANLLAEINKHTGEARITGAIRDDVLGDMMGKRDTDLALWDNIHFTYNSSYLTRDQEGQLLPLGDWSSADTPWVSTFALRDGITARYGDFQGGDGDFYVLISVIDTQMNVYSSELIPVKSQVSAPETPEKPQAMQVDFSMESQEPALLMEDRGITLSLDGLAATPEALSLLFTARNALAEEVSLSTDWAMVNGFMMEPTGFASVPAGGSAMLVMDFPVPAGPVGASLQQAGITEAREIRFRFALGFADGSLLRTDYTEDFHINTQVPLGDMPPVQANPFEPVTLASGDGISIELVGEPFMDGDYFHIPLKAINSSTEFDTISLAESAVNGVMAPLIIPERLPPGAAMYTTASILLQKITLPPEYAEFQYLFDGMDNLESLGIAAPGEVTLRFAMSRESAGDRTPGLRFEPRAISLPGAEGENPPLDTTGVVLFDQAGISITRLSSDPSGKKLYLHNSGPVTVKISTFGRVAVDGVPYGSNVPIHSVISPGASAYAKLFDYLPGIEPEGKEISFHISLVNLEENTLLFMSDKIALELIGASEP